MGYKFGWRGPEVEIPELEAFMTELRALCERYGIGFELNSYGEGCGGIVIVPFDNGDWDIFADHLEEYEGGIPFLDQAKAEYERLQEEQRQRQAQAELERNKRAQAADEERLRRDGIRLSDGLYRLVKDGP